jgi:hypothetical protein
MTEFIPNLWLYTTKQTRKINTRHLLHIDTEKEMDYLTGDPSRLTHELIKIYRFVQARLIDIHRELSNNRLVIISCKTAKYIGPLIIACYLIRYGEMTIGDALNSMKSKKADVFDGEVMYSQILERISENK